MAERIIGYSKSNESKIAVFIKNGCKSLGKMLRLKCNDQWFSITEFKEKH